MGVLARSALANRLTPIKKHTCSVRLRLYAYKYVQGWIGTSWNHAMVTFYVSLTFITKYLLLSTTGSTDCKPNKTHMQHSTAVTEWQAPYAGVSPSPT